MPRKTKLTRKMIQEIVKLIKLRLNWKEIGIEVGVTPKTLRVWYKIGETAEKGIYKEYYIAIEKAQNSIYREHAEVVIDAATKNRVSITIKETTDYDGRTKTEKTTKILPPDHRQADRNLDKVAPDRWLSVKSYQIFTPDWKDSLLNRGLTEEEINELHEECLKHLRESFKENPVEGKKFDEKHRKK